MVEKIELQDKFIGFIDILGYSSLTKAAEENRSLSLYDLEKILAMLGSDKDRTRFEKDGPTTCPMAPRLQRNMDFQIAQVWDSVVVSAEVSPAGVINLIAHCFDACIHLLAVGVMCRGYIKRGKIHHEGTRIFGSGHVDTVEKEKQVSFYKRDAQERGTPFIEVDPEVLDYVTRHGDECVKKMFSRMVVTHENVTAIFPMKLVSHSFSLHSFGVPPFDSKKEKKSNDDVRQGIIGLKNRVREHVKGANESAVRKSEHYIRALDQQLKVCDRTDDIIDQLCGGFPRN